MMRSHLFARLVLFFFSLQLFTGVSYALEGDILFNRIDVDGGLPSNEVSCILKDRKGFMWFGTEVGLVRYDGYEFKTFRHVVDGSLFSEEYIVKLTETADGMLWITYQNGEISVFDPRTGRFSTVGETAAALGIDREITDVFQENHYQLLFKTTDGALCRYDYATEEISCLPVEQGGESVCDVTVKGDWLYAVYHSGRVAIIPLEGTDDALTDDYLKGLGLSAFNLYVDSANELWIYLTPENYNGLFRFSPRTKQWMHYTAESSPRLTSSRIRAVEEDSHGNIWIATDHGGVNILDRQKGSILAVENDPFDRRSISQNSVICLYRDDTGILWCGTYKNGISYYHASIFKFNTIRLPVGGGDEVSINDCNSVYEDARGTLWIGTNGSGLVRYDRSTGQYRRYRHDPADPHSLNTNIIVSMTGDGDGNLWIGTYTGGLERFDGTTFMHYLPREGGLSNSSIYSLFADDEGWLWIGTLGGGLDALHLKTQAWKHFDSTGGEGSLLSDRVYSISAGNKNELLIGTALGVNMLNTQTGHMSSFSGTRSGHQPFRGKAINAVFRDRRDLLWIGSTNGLSIYDSVNDSLYHLDKAGGLPDDNIVSIQQDDAGTLWMGTKNCLLKVIPIYDKSDKEYRFDCTVYYESEGISGRIFNRNSTCRTSGGELVFGGVNGLTLFDPSQIQYNTNPPKVTFTDLYIRNQFILPGQKYDNHVILTHDISYTDELTLRYEERGFSLNISPLNYFLPEKNKLSFRMEGFDKDWSLIDATTRSITYTNLPAGSYTLVVKAENNDGLWSDTAATLRIRIKPPFWATPLAIALYAVMTLVLIYIIIYIILRFQKRKFQKQQADIVTNQIHEMDEMKLRFFTNISHEFRTPLTLILAPVEKLMKGEERPENKKILQLIHENASQLLTLVNQLLDFRKIDVQGVKLLLSSGDIVLFIRNITYSFKDLSDHKNIRFSFSSTIPSLGMKFDTDKIFKVVSNLLSNAFKFTPEGGEIGIHLQLQNPGGQGNELIIQVSDTGIGIPEDKQELIFNRFYQIPPDGKSEAPVGTGIGLHICREFVRMHNGTITVRSEPGKGSTFTVALPVTLPEIEEIISAPEKPAVAESYDDEALPIAEDSGRTLLVVDDNPKFREFMQLSLKDSFHILTAADGEEAWQVILKRLPDMVISDVMMPVTDGIMLCKRIKQDIRTSHIPVILLTAKSAETSKLTGLEAGADDYIGKPFNMDVLILKIRHIIEMKDRMQKQFMQSTGKGIQLTSMNINSLDEELMKKSISFIEEQIANPGLSVEWLSREMGMSRVNFYKKTLSITGKTPVELIRSIRMKHAAEMLEKSRMRVSEAAFKVGINDSKLFRKYFKDEFGVLPSDYVETRK